MPTSLTPDLHNPHGLNPDLLCDAVRTLDVGRCVTLISQGALVNKKDSRGQTPLYLAVEAGRADICKLLVENGADVRRQVAGWDKPINLAIRGTSANAVAILGVLYEADMQVPGDKTSWYKTYNSFLTPFQYAVARGATDSATLLLDKFGEDPGQLTMDGVEMVDLTTSPVMKELLRGAIAQRAVTSGVDRAATERSGEARKAQSPSPL